MNRLASFFLNNKLVVFLVVVVIVGWGIAVAPFDWDVRGIPRDPVPVDAIPDIGENQQIVFTKWPGRSPQDMEDQITYPLTVAILGMPGIKTVRSFSMFGFSSIYVIFKEDVDFYWSRSRILEKLNSLPSGTLPQGVRPVLGPDATALGQVFWYTLEGRDEEGEPTGGWDLHELRSIQDYYVRYALLSSEGISEVASIGGFVQEYQVDVDPEAMQAHGITLTEVFNALKMSNQDVGARTMEINRVEYVIRGIGFIKTIEDIENTVVKVNKHVPITIKQVATVAIGPALRRGALDKEGSEVVGGVVVVRYGENPLGAIKNLKRKIHEISPGLPQRQLRDGRISQVTIVPFYDRTGLIAETLNTLKNALTEEVLVTVIVVLLMLFNLKSSLLIAGLLPLAVLMSFIGMRYAGVDANIVALSGIAIAIGTMVDMGIVIVENILRRLEQAGGKEGTLKTVARATAEVGGAVTTAVATTVVSFLPVFFMQAAEGKLFRPLAYTKTFALIASIIVALVVIPPAAHGLFGGRLKLSSIKKIFFPVLVSMGIAFALFASWWVGVLIIIVVLYHLIKGMLPARLIRWESHLTSSLAVFVVAVILARHWMPMGPEKGLIINFIFIGLIIGIILFLFYLFARFYARMLKWILEHKRIFVAVLVVVLFWGGLGWLGFDSFFGWLPATVKRFGPVSYFAHKFPGLGREFMPPLDEGAFLYMPTTMPHASIGETMDVLRKQDMAFAGIPEVESAVGKLGRADSPLDPAPVSMIETVINYKSMFILDEDGTRLRFEHSSDENDFVRSPEGTPLLAPDGQPYKVKGKFERDEAGQLIPDTGGIPFRLWRPGLLPELNPGRAYWRGIRSADDIWEEIVRAGRIPGTTSAPKLQPISARLVMLQSGMRTPMGIKVKGPDLETIQRVGLQLEKFLKEVPMVEASAVIADRIVGKPYLQVEIDRRAIARYGIQIQNVQDVIEVAIGGKAVTTTVEGRERYSVRVRYPRELRNSIEEIQRILVPVPNGARVTLGQLATINYVRGPQMIKSEDTFLLGYVVFDGKAGYAEVDVVEQARRYLESRRISGELEIPVGVSYSFTGSYENQVRSQETMSIILPLALLIIFLILYFQFRQVYTTILVFSGIAVAWAGGFILLWFYGQSWFLDISFVGVHMQELFNIHPVNLSVAVWVGFLALFGIASDDGVIMATYLNQVFGKRKPTTIEDIRRATVEAGVRRIRPALMTTATTILALLPVLTSTGRGSDIMIPMAIPTVGGMLVALLTLFVVPVFYAWRHERLARQ